MDPDLTDRPAPAFGLAGLLLSVTADTVIRIVPPLIFTPADADELVARLAPLVKAFLAEQA